MSHSIDILNGAQCEKYSWNQNYADLEICIKIPNDKSPCNLSISSDELRLDITTKSILLLYESEIFLKGQFSKEINKQSLIWSIERDNNNSVFTLTIYLDKLHNLWWAELLVGERQLQLGAKSRITYIEELNDDPRMILDRLIIDAEKSRQIHNT